MNKISFIIEFDEVSKTQEEQLTEFIEKTGIKFHVLESDNDLKKYEKYKEIFDKLKEWINIVQQNKDNKHLEPFISTDELDELLDILNEVSE